MKSLEKVLLLKLNQSTTKQHHTKNQTSNLTHLQRLEYPQSQRPLNLQSSLGNVSTTPQTSNNPKSTDQKKIVLTNMQHQNPTLLVPSLTWLPVSAENLMNGSGSFRARLGGYIIYYICLTISNIIQTLLYSYTYQPQYKYINFILYFDQVFCVENLNYPKQTKKIQNHYNDNTLLHSPQTAYQNLVLRHLIVLSILFVC
eukprot:TRINITY_DN9031_c0_g1_i1.p1 TRINITY_DN9031_c0_g1~~TRINITY_DN9031_c0_g1_i1.p1  ORF type:complete len:200 (+),score=-18.53 TRINITY_DN9031_c0_g1_i1:384-983(+)